MKIASWNVNSLRVRLPQVLDWLETTQPDVLGLQETKMTDDVFPVAQIREIGYEVVYAGQKTYNGVALISKSPVQEVITDIPGLEDEQRRILGASVDGVRFLNLYVVNGKEVGSDKYEWKLYWLDKVCDYIASQLVEHKQFVVMGDFNIAPADEDVHDPEAWHEKILCSSSERRILQRLFDMGLSDSFRLFDQKEKSFSWWDYRAAGFRRNLGLRIDLVLISPRLSDKCQAASIDTAPRRLKRPSDHAPVIVDIAL